MRDSVLFYRSFIEAIDMLPPDDRLAAYEAIAHYGLDGTDPMSALDGVAGAVFMLAKPQIDANNRRYENGCKGGAPKGNRNASKEQPKTTEKQPKNNQGATKIQPKEKEKDKDNIKDPLKGGTGGKETQAQMLNRLMIGRAVTHDIADALSEWVSYKSQRNERYKEAGMRSLITQAVNTAAENGPQAVIDVINRSMASNYKGIVWDRAKRKTERTAYRNNRSTYNSGLEKMLVATN